MEADSSNRHDLNPGGRGATPARVRRAGRSVISAARPARRADRVQLASDPPTASKGLATDFKTVILTGVGSTLLGSDIRRLVPRKMHLPNFKSPFDIVKIIPNRHPKSLVRRPAYNIVFESAASAQHFLAMQQSIFSRDRSQWPDVLLPPGSVPMFSPAGFRSVAVNEQEVLLPGFVKSPPGASVLLTASLDGRINSLQRLPDTRELRELLEDIDVQFDKKDANDMEYGLQRVMVRDGSPTDQEHFGDDRKWIVRCGDTNEAHRVVRYLHRWRPRGYTMFRAEVI